MSWRCSAILRALPHSNKRNAGILDSYGELKPAWTGWGRIVRYDLDIAQIQTADYVALRARQTESTLFITQEIGKRRDKK